MSATGDWSAAELIESVDLINFRVGAWNNLQYPESVPAAGEHGAAAITAAHGAIEEIDKTVRELHKIRGYLVDELRANEDALMAWSDAKLNAGRAMQDGTR